ncbi:MAG: helix-turn-helix transcriptional regulator, partial [Spirochaetales bacterium]|nr:helix-turn-helix transcriptional regulator [Spirochaetales bacterium]
MKKNIFKKGLMVLLCIIIPLSVSVYIFLSIGAGEKKYTLYPGRDVWTAAFGDYQESGGKSIVNRFDATREHIIFTYTLKRGFINPYAGFAIGKHEYINLESFDVMRIKIGSAHSHSMRVFLFTKIPGYTIEKNFNTYLHLQKEISVQKECLEYTITLAELYTPEWWYARELSENDPGLTRDFSNVYSVSIQSGINHPVDLTDTVTLEEICFYKNNHTLTVMLIFIWILYTGGILSFFLLKQYKTRSAKKINKVVKTCRDIPSDHNYGKEAEKIITYIGDQYSNRDLTIGKVSRACEIPEIKIRRYIKKYFDVSFPRYLNAIRLAEAKRLLKETGLRISEIAFLVGFNSIPHFNRIFKENEK